MEERYSRQIAFRGIGEHGQRALQDSRVAIVGLGALGTVAADRLCRAGVGYLRLIDNDAVELSNLHRQSLYTEKDIGKPKADTSAARLKETNSGITIEPINARLANKHDLMLSGIDLVIDCTDNAAARYMINEICYGLGIPWVHGAAAGSGGSVFAIEPGGACFRCLYPDEDAARVGDSAATLGMLNSLTAVVGALEASEALKILIGAPTFGLLMLDIWNGAFELVDMRRDPNCPVCGG